MRRIIVLLAIMTIALVLGSGVALAAVKSGTEGRNILIGTSDKDVLYGKGGNDLLDGLKGDDILYAGAGSDEVFSFSGNDTIYGEDGNDLLFEGQGNNIIFGGRGNDFIQATAIDPDSSGSDKRTPKKRDLVFCGPGKDIVAVDPGGVDFTASDCEKVLIRTGEGDIGL